jgi:hypothetical protein
MGRSSAYRGGGTKRARDREWFKRNVDRCQDPTCGVLLDWENPHLPNSGCVDHIIPLARAEELGYTREYLLSRENLQALCLRDNRAKSDRLPGELRERNRATGRFAHKDPEVRNGRCACGQYGAHHHDDGSFHDRTPGAVRFITGRDWWTKPRSRMTQ